MNLIDISYELAARMFPGECWVEEYKNVFVAQSRIPRNSEQKAVFQKELVMACIASDCGHIVYLLPELSDFKNADAVMDGILTEFKAVTGGENAISHRFREALHQGCNVYLKIDSDVKEKRVRQILHGVLKDKACTGLVYCYFSNSRKMYCWRMADLK